jgi:hypothetical protein
VSAKIRDSLGSIGKVWYLFSISLRTGWFASFVCLYGFGGPSHLLIGIGCFLIISLSFAGVTAYIGLMLSAPSFLRFTEGKVLKEANLSDYFTQKEIRRIGLNAFGNSLETAHSGARIFEVSGAGSPRSLVTHIVGNWIAIPASLAHGRLVKFLLAHELCHTNLMGGKAVMGANLLVVLYIAGSIYFFNLLTIGGERFLFYGLLAAYLLLYVSRGRVFAEAVADNQALELLRSRDQAYVRQSVLSKRYIGGGSWASSGYNRFRRMLYEAYLNREMRAIFWFDHLLDYLPGLAALGASIFYFGKSTNIYAFTSVAPFVLGNLLLLVFAHKEAMSIQKRLERLA